MIPLPAAMHFVGVGHAIAHGVIGAGYSVAVHGDVTAPALCGGARANRNVTSPIRTSNRPPAAANHRQFVTCPAPLICVSQKLPESSRGPEVRRVGVLPSPNA